MKRDPTPNRQLSFWPSVVAVGVGIPFLFWIRFGVVNSFALGLTAFLLILMFAVQFLAGPPAAATAAEPEGAKNEHEATPPLPAPVRMKMKWYDLMGVGWLLAIPLAPLSQWLIGSLTTIEQSNWMFICGVRAFVAIVIPVACAIPLLRYLRKPNAHIALLILFIGTAYPVSTGIASATDFFRGPVWESVDIQSLHTVHISIRMRDIVTRTEEALLSDGRMLESNSEVSPLHTGSAKILVLESLGLIIAADQTSEPQRSNTVTP